MAMPRVKLMNIDRLLELASDCSPDNRGYGLAELSRITGVSTEMLNRVLRGDNDLALASYYKIATTTGVSIDWLLGLSDSKYRKNDYTTIQNALIVACQTRSGCPGIRHSANCVKFKNCVDCWKEYFIDYAKTTNG